MPDGVKSRLILRVEEQPHLPSAAAPPSSEIVRPRQMPRCLRGVTARLGSFLTRRRFGRVDRLIRHRKFDAALDVLDRLAEAGHGNSPGFSTLYNSALDGVRRALKEELRSVDARRDHKKPNRPLRQAESRRREVLAQLAWIHDKAGDTDETYRALRDWRASFDAGGRRGRERSTAADMTFQMAEIDLQRRKLKSALRLCEEARELGPPAKLDLTEARVQLALGHRSAARRCFERHIDKDLDFMHRRLASIPAGSPS